MKYVSATELFRLINSHFQDGQYREAFDLATEGLNLFPDRAPYLNYWRIGLAARLDDGELACDVLENMLEAGIWYSQRILRESPSLQTLQGHPQFERLVEKSYQQQSLAKEEQLLVLEPEIACHDTLSPCPLLIALHGNNSNAKDSAEVWQPIVEDGWLVALAQSSEIFWKNAHVWHDPKLAAEEIGGHYERLCDRNAIDSNRIIVSGFSRGGYMAIWIALASSIKTRGFIAVAPSLDEAAKLHLLVEEKPSEGLRGYIIAGDRDDVAPVQEVQELVAMLNRAGIPCGLETNPDIGHEFPSTFEQSLAEAVKFVLDG